jgi:hypothetical protein
MQPVKLVLPSILDLTLPISTIKLTLTLPVSTIAAFSRYPRLRCNSFVGLLLINAQILL